jgi:hypothetical protein
MSQSQRQADGDEYPFPTDTDDGCTFTLLCFNHASGQWYEFVPPEQHDDYLRLRDPRTGETISFSSRLNKMKRMAVGSIIVGPADADKWADLRATYLDHNEPFEQYEQARKQLFKPTHERLRG